MARRQVKNEYICRPRQLWANPKQKEMQRLTGRQTTNSNVTVSNLQEYDILKANVSLFTGQFIQQAAVWTTYSLNLEDTSSFRDVIEALVYLFQENKHLSRLLYG